MARYVISSERETIPFEECDTEEKRILQNAKNLLMLRMGEVPFDRLRGIDPRLFEMPLPQMQEEALPEVDRVLAWEPRVQAESATCRMVGDGEAMVEVVITMTEGENE